MVRNLPSIAGDEGSIPGQGTKITHAPGQLSPLTTTREARVHPGLETKHKHNKQKKLSKYFFKTKEKEEKLCQSSQASSQGKAGG